MENNHDCLEVMQFLYYKSASKNILKSERVVVTEEKSGLGTGTKKERGSDL